MLRLWSTGMRRLQHQATTLTPVTLIGIYAYEQRPPLGTPLVAPNAQMGG